MNKEWLHKWIDGMRRAERNNSKWDNNRTDRAVFVERTFNKWLSGKYWCIKEQNRKLSEEKYFTFTHYVYVVNVRFNYGWQDKIVVLFLYPHSQTYEEKTVDLNTMFNLELIENEVDWKILKKFYPVFEQAKPDPFCDIRGRLKEIESNHEKKRKAK